MRVGVRLGVSRDEGQVWEWEGSGRSGVVGNNDTERIGVGGAGRSGYEST